MKKLFTLVVVVVLMVVGAKAQTEIVVGPKVGLNMTNISNSDKKNKLSFFMYFTPNNIHKYSGKHNWMEDHFHAHYNYR